MEGFIAPICITVQLLVKSIRNDEQDCATIGCNEEVTGFEFRQTGEYLGATIRVADEDHCPNRIPRTGTAITSDQHCDTVCLKYQSDAIVEVCPVVL